MMVQTDKQADLLVLISGLEKVENSLEELRNLSNNLNFEPLAREAGTLRDAFKNRKTSISIMLQKANE